MTAPDGYQIGTVFLQVLPSLRHLNTRTAAKAAGIQDIPIKVEPELAVAAAKTEMKTLVKELEATPVTKDVELELNERKFNAKIRELLARRDEMVVRVDADVSAAYARIEELERKRGRTKIDVDAEIAKARAKIATLTNRRDTIIAQFDVDISKAQSAIATLRDSLDDEDVDIDVDVHIEEAERKLNQVDQSLKRLRNNQADINMEASDASRAIAIVGALTAGLAVLGHVAGAAAAAVATVPNALAAASQVVGTIMAGLSGVGDATKALQAVEDEATLNANANSKTRVAAANRVASAQSALERALENADRTAIQNARAVEEAREGVADAVEDGARRVTNAEKDLARAQVTARDAQEALTRARKDAAERLEDLHLATAGAALDEEAAVIALQRARQRLAAGQAAGVGGLDLAELQLGARQAEQSLNEIRERLGDLRSEQAESNRTGIEGSAGVVDAQRRVADATSRVREAEQGLADLRAEAADRVADAQERVSEAQQRASWAASDASRQVADAQRALADASETAGAAGSAAMDKLTLAMSKLSPEGQRFAEFLSGTAKPAMQDLAAAAAGTMLPKVQTAFGILLTQQSFVQDAFALTGDTIGDIAIKGAQMVTSGPWRADFGTIVLRNNRLLEHMGDAGLSALDSVRHLMIASGPLTESLAASAEASLAQAAAFLETKRETGELQMWFAQMSTRLNELWATVSQIAKGFWDLIQAIAPLGKVLLDIVGPLVEIIGAFAEANPTLTTVIALAVLLGSSFISLFRTLGGLGQAVRTSVGVFQGMRASLVGVKRPIDDVATGAAAATRTTDQLGQASQRTGGLLGRVRDRMSEVAASYRTGASAAGAWATQITTTAVAGSTAVGANAERASQAVNRSINTFLPGTARIQGAFRTMSDTVVTSFQRVTSVIGGAATATAKSAGTIITGLASALGGPFGIAIGAATIGLGILAQKQAEAAQEAAEHKARIESLTDALVSSNGAIDDSVKKQVLLGLEQREVADNARNLGLNVGDMIRAITDGGSAASSFEGDLFGLSEQLANGAGLAKSDAVFLNELAQEIYRTGGSARDFQGDIAGLVRDFQHSTGATDAQTDAFRKQVVEFLDLVGGYRGARGDFDTAEQQQRDIADAQNSAASETDRHTRALKALQDRVLGNIDKDLAHRNALQSLSEAQARVASASEKDMPAALLQQEQAMLDVITTAGELAYANSKGSTDQEKLRDATLAQAQAAADLANKFSGPLPAALQMYLDKMGIAKDDTGQYKVVLEGIPSEVLTNPRFDDKDARQKIIDFHNFMVGKLTASELLIKAGLEPTMVNIRAANQEKRGWANGGVAVAAYASGAIRPMSADRAQIVPPRSLRIIGDRMKDDEGFVPINTSPQSIAILAEIARRMRFQLVPMAMGGVLGMADGGVASGGVAASGAVLALNPDAIDAFAESVRALISGALAPLATEINTVTAPSMARVGDQAASMSVAFGHARTDVTASWAGIVAVSGSATGSIRQHLTALQGMAQQTATAFRHSAEWIRTAWAQVPGYTAVPVRASIAGPYNKGLIPAWNYLNTFFALNKPLKELPIPFAIGGQVPGSGNGDTVPALLTPGEYVISKPVVKKWGLANIDAAHMAARRGGFPGLEGMLSGDDRGIYRVGFASGGPVPEALARATRFGMSMHGKPYVWGGSSEAGTDCSGWMAMLARALMDEKPYARREWATASTAGGNPPPRFARGIDGLFAIGVNPGVHTAGTMAGRNVESGGAHNYVAFGSPATGADDSQFPLKFHLASLGGNFVSGGAGGMFDLGTFIRSAFADTYGQVASLQRAWGANLMALAGSTLTSRAADALIEYADKAINLDGMSGDVESWRPLVLQALRMLGLPAEWADITLRRMAQESGGNPLAVNDWDVNAQRGDPSRGLMQVIGSTFAAYRDTRAPDNVLDPLANILASMKYAMARYGSLPSAYGRAGGYDNGGLLPPGYSTVYNGLRRPEMILTDNQWNALISLADMNTGAGGDFRGNLYLSSGEFLGAVEGVIDRANTDSGRVLARRIR